MIRVSGSMLINRFLTEHLSYTSMATLSLTTGLANAAEMNSSIVHHKKKKASSN